MSMRVAWSVENLDIELQENKITVITIENTEAYVDFLMNLNLQAEGQTGTIIVSDGVKEQNFVKVLTKLYQELQEIADTVCQEKYIQVKSDLIAFMDELADNSSYALEFDLEFEISSLLKIFNMHLLNNAQGLLENIIEYIKAQSRICNIKNFFFINLKDYLNEKDIDMLYEFVRYEKVNLILAESH